MPWLMPFEDAMTTERHDKPVIVVVGADGARLTDGTYRLKRRNHFPAPQRRPETNRVYSCGVQSNGEPAMNTIVASVLKREAAGAGADVRPFTTVALFCGVGLLASLCMASFGLDVSAGFF
jgi:hypothetical protein